MQRLRARRRHVTCCKVNGDHQIELSAPSKIVYKRVFNVNIATELLNDASFLSFAIHQLSCPAWISYLSPGCLKLSNKVVLAIGLIIPTFYFNRSVWICVTELLHSNIKWFPDRIEVIFYILCRVYLKPTSIFTYSIKAKKWITLSK